MFPKTTTTKSARRVVLFHTSESLFNALLSRIQLDSQICFLLSITCHVGSGKTSLQENENEKEHHVLL